MTLGGNAGFNCQPNLSPAAKTRKVEKKRKVEMNWLMDRWEAPTRFVAQMVVVASVGLLAGGLAVVVVLLGSWLGGALVELMVDRTLGA